MNRRKWIASAAIASIVVIAGAGIVLGGGTGDTDTPLAGSALDQAKAAALAHTSGGTVVDSEVGDGNAAYSVEIQQADGSVVEVQLDEAFTVIGTEADDDSAGGDSATDD
jgi:hypothetical protein